MKVKIDLEFIVDDLHDCQKLAIAQLLRADFTRGEVSESMKTPEIKPVIHPKISDLNSNGKTSDIWPPLEPFQEFSFTAPVKAKKIKMSKIAAPPPPVFAPEVDDSESGTEFIFDMVHAGKISYQRVSEMLRLLGVEDLPQAAQTDGALQKLTAMIKAEIPDVN